MIEWATYVGQGRVTIVGSSLNELVGLTDVGLALKLLESIVFEDQDPLRLVRLLDLERDLAVELEVKRLVNGTERALTQLANYLKSIVNYHIKLIIDTVQFMPCNTYQDTNQIKYLMI